jgi:nicotinate-nucleotide adenylyltransferase
MKISCHSIGLFGGTFNPVHIGHLRLAEDVREEFGLDMIVFIPAHIPPHKKITHDPGSDHRLNMIRGAIEGNVNFLCDDIELRRGGISYTIDTVEYVYENYQFEKKPSFIIGSDLYNELETWKDIDRLVKMVQFIVLLRENQNTDIPMEDRNMEGIIYFSKRRLNITSSEIRQRIFRNLSIRYLVTDEVFRYIKKNKLYTM